MLNFASEHATHVHACRTLTMTKEDWNFGIYLIVETPICGYVHDQWENFVSK